MKPITWSCGFALPLVATLLAGVEGASAATFQYNGYGVVNEFNVTIGHGSDSGLPPGFEYGYFGSGEILLYGSGSNKGQTLGVWCIDATHILQGSDTYTITHPTTDNGGVGGLNNGLSHSQLGEIGALVKWGDANINTNTWVSAAVQLAIWAIEYPGAKFTSDSSIVNGKVPLLVSYAQNPTNWFFGLSEVIDPKDNQGLVFTTPTPLPPTWTMLLGGFAGLGFFAYRGTKNRSAAVA